MSRKHNRGCLQGPSSEMLCCTTNEVESSTLWMSSPPSSGILQEVQACSLIDSIPETDVHPLTPYRCWHSHQPSSGLTEFLLAHADLYAQRLHKCAANQSRLLPALHNCLGKKSGKSEGKGQNVGFECNVLPITEMRIRSNIKPLLLSHVTFWRADLQRIEVCCTFSDSFMQLKCLFGNAFHGGSAQHAKHTKYISIYYLNQ